MAYLCMRILLSLLCLCSASEAIQCSGFSIEPPAGWKISCEGDDLGGGLNASGASGSFSLSWIQNPGLEPDEILDLVESAYESGDSSVLSSRRGRLAVEGGEAVVLDLAYSIWGKQAQRSFAAWSSGRSDRIFLLSERSDGTGMLQSIVSSFRDLATTEHLAMGPLPESGPWPALLQDLLRSYHYADPGELSAARAHLAVRHNLIPDNGSLVVESSESLWSEPSQKALARARAVVQILEAEGYEAMPVRWQGDIAVAACDPSGRWQRISVNPEQPERMVGVLSDGRSEALACEETAQWTAIQPAAVVRHCEPPRYVELPSGDADQRWLEGLRDLLEEHEYGRPYEEGVFDCSNTSQICWALLDGEGYDARIMRSYPGHPLDPHMWVVVGNGQGVFLAIETATTQGREIVHMGRIVEGSEYLRGLIYNSSEQIEWLQLG